MNFMRYYVNYGTGAGNEYVDGSLEDAKKVAQEGLAYTQTDVKIQTEEGEDVAVLSWYGVQPKEDDVVIAKFGDYGFYSDWIDC